MRLAMSWTSGTGESWVYGPGLPIDQFWWPTKDRLRTDLYRLSFGSVEQ